MLALTARPVAQFLWVGPGLSPLENLCLKSFVTVGYEVHLYSYGPLERVPEGVILKDAGEIIPADDQFFGPNTCNGQYANFSDRFRYYLLLERGGWWFDTDHVALKVLPEPTDLYVASQWEGYEHPTGSVLWCKPGDARIAWAKERCDAILAKGGERSYIALGPALVKEMVEHFGLKLAPWWEFNPVQHYYIERLVYRTNREWATDVVRYFLHRGRELWRPGYRAAYIRPKSRAIHLSNEIWRARGLDKWAVYHPRSGKLQRQHGFSAD